MGALEDSSGGNDGDEEMSGLGIFGQIAAILGPYVGGADVAGLILGFATIVSIMLSTAILFSIAKAAINPTVMLIMGFFSLGFVLAVQWFPSWVAILIVILCAAMIVQKLHSGGGSSDG